jgi:hypothetical protein
MRIIISLVFVFVHAEVIAVADFEVVFVVDIVVEEAEDTVVLPRMVGMEDVVVVVVVGEYVLLFSCSLVLFLLVMKYNN